MNSNTAGTTRTGFSGCFLQSRFRNALSTHSAQPPEVSSAPGPAREAVPHTPCLLSPETQLGGADGHPPMLAHSAGAADVAVFSGSRIREPRTRAGLVLLMNMLIPPHICGALGPVQSNFAASHAVLRTPVGRLEQPQLFPSDLRENRDQRVSWLAQGHTAGHQSCQKPDLQLPLRQDAASLYPERPVCFIHI